MVCESIDKGLKLWHNDDTMCFFLLLVHIFQETSPEVDCFNVVIANRQQFSIVQILKDDRNVLFQ